MTINKKRINLLPIIGTLIEFLILAGIVLIWFKVKAPAPIVKVEKNVIEVEMDKSCFTQFQNNVDKSIYVKLTFKE